MVVAMPLVWLCAFAAQDARRDFVQWLSTKSPWCVTAEALYEEPGPTRQFRLFVVHRGGVAWYLVAPTVVGVEPSGSRFTGVVKQDSSVALDRPGYSSDELLLRQAMPSRIGMDVLKWPDRVKSARPDGRGWEADVLCAHTVLTCDPEVFGPSANPSLTTIRFDEHGRVTWCKPDRADAPTVFSYPDAPTGTAFVSGLGGRSGPDEEAMPLVSVAGVSIPDSAFERDRVAERAVAEEAKPVPSAKPLPLMPRGSAATKDHQSGVGASHSINWPLLVTGAVFITIGGIAWWRRR